MMKVFGIDCRIRCYSDGLVDGYMRVTVVAHPWWNFHDERDNIEDAFPLWICWDQRLGNMDVLGDRSTLRMKL